MLSSILISPNLIISLWSSYHAYIVFPGSNQLRLDLYRASLLNVSCDNIQLAIWYISCSSAVDGEGFCLGVCRYYNRGLNMLGVSVQLRRWLLEILSWSILHIICRRVYWWLYQVLAQESKIQVPLPWPSIWEMLRRRASIFYQGQYRTYYLCTEATTLSVSTKRRLSEGFTRWSCCWCRHKTW